MAEINWAIMEAALRSGMFVAPLSEDMADCLHRSVVTGADIVSYLDERGELGADRETLADAMELNGNTIGFYCRWLTEKALIFTVPNPVQGGAHTYYSGKLPALPAQNLPSKKKSTALPHKEAWHG